MRIVITGATGLIGSALGSHLAAAGHEVLGLSRNPGSRPMPGFELAAWDAKDASALAGLIDGADAVVNLASAGISDKRWSEARKRVISESRIDGGRAVAQAVVAAANRPRVVIQGSAIGYYGDRGDEIVDESFPAGSDYLAQLCVAWEAASAPVQDVGVRQVVIRTGIVQSTAGGALSEMLPFFRLGLGGRLGSGRQWFPWIHIDDYVDAVVFLLERPVDGPFNLSAPAPETNARYTRVLGQVINRPTPWVVPPIALRVVFGGVAETLTTSLRVVPARLGELGFGFTYPSLEPALRSLLAEDNGRASRSG